MNQKIPTFPVVHVTVHPDGSAHVNVAGTHVDYPAADLEVTRAEVIAYAVNVAAGLGRGVRMTTTDPAGQWKLGVYPDGEVVDLEPAPAKGRGVTRKLQPAPSATTRPAAPSPSDSTVVLERAPELTTPRTALPPSTRRAPRADGTPVATLKFSTGDVAIIGDPAIIGRSPESSADTSGQAGTVQYVTIHDKERNVSRAHLDVAWVRGRLVATDRGAGNGTVVVRPTGRYPLEPGKAFEIQHGDVLEVGTVVTCDVAVSYLQGGETR